MVNSIPWKYSLSSGTTAHMLLLLLLEDMPMLTLLLFFLTLLRQTQLLTLPWLVLLRLLMTPPLWYLMIVHYQVEVD